MSPFLPKLPLRTETHVIDTLAVRQVLQHLPADLLIRSMEERDYGIDLQLERFDGSRPTGQMALVQVKGRDAKFASNGDGDGVSLAFPVKTIEYARLFDKPFFVFHTSIQDQTTYFLWLQSYANAVLDTRPDGDAWRTQDDVTIHFPACNKLDPAGWSKLRDYFGYQHLRREGLEVVKLEAELRRFGQFALDSAPFSRETCIRAARRLPLLRQFFLGRTGILEAQLDAFSHGLVQAFERAALLSHAERAAAQALLAELLASLEMPLMEFLTHDTTDQASVQLGETPY